MMTSSPWLRCAMLTWLILGLLAPLAAAEPNGANHPAQAPQVTDVTRQLLASLPQVPEVESHDNAVVWHGDGMSQAILGIDPATNDPLLDTPAGPLRIARRLLENHRTSVLGALPGLLTILKAKNLAAKDFQLEEGLLTGPSLRNEASVVVAEGLLSRHDPATIVRDHDLSALSAAVAALVASTSATSLDGIGRAALTDVVRKLDHADGDEAPDEITPSFARRVVRHGWLMHWFTDPASAALAHRVEQLIAAAEELKAVREFSGDGVRLAEVHDAFGQGGWVFSTPKHVLYQHLESHPEYLGEISELMVIIELPAGANPVTDAAKAISARSLHGSTPLASWSLEKGFKADPALWRATVPITSQDLVPNAIPPHIVISGMNGEVAGLAVEQGLLRPAADATPASAERFLSDAARLLPDAASLDLVGEYLFSYVYPSPDPNHPELMGNRQQKGNVQQTVWQSCSNVAGGVMHGDCADIAEVYSELTTRQGRNPIIIGLPEHAACAWAEHADSLWHVAVLQTGPPLQFGDASLPKCLEKAYKSFDPAMPFDANELPLLLRFSGEVSRSAWSLSWRIFSEPAYAKTMIDVQRDWHYETYQRGITAMKKLIKDGDDDNANYRELSGLYTFTGQYALAAAFHKQAMDRTDDPVSKLYMSVQLIGFQLNAHQLPEAAATAEDVLKVQLPLLKERLGPAYLQVCLELAQTSLNQDGGPALRSYASRALVETLMAPLGDYLDKISAWLASDDFNADTWDNSNDFRSLRTILDGYVTTITQLLVQLGSDRLPGDPALNGLVSAGQKWLNGIAFHDVEDNSTVLMRYAEAGNWYRAIQGPAAFDPLLDAATMATNPKVDHAKRVGGAAQVAIDLPWIKASVPYWYGRIAYLFRKDQDALDPKLVSSLAAHLEAAHAATVALGLSSPDFEQQALLAAEVNALISHDEPALRAILKRVAGNNDKDLRDNAAQWLGDSARFLDQAWYARVLSAWRDEVDYKPKYFWIAWRAALNKAPEQALMAGKLAAERFPDDPAFVEEYRVMQQLLGHHDDPAGMSVHAGATPGAK
jgi:hypothetical protein